MESLLKSLTMLWPAKGPPAGSEKQPRGVKPEMLVAKGLPVLDFVEVANAVIVDGAVVVAAELGEELEGAAEGAFVEVTELEELKEVNPIFVAKIEELAPEPALVFLYVDNREPAPH